MGQVLRVTIIILLVVGVVTVLWTPDPTDDVRGLVRQQRLVFSLGSPSALPHSDVSRASPLYPDSRSPHPVHDFQLADLICVRLC